MEKIRTFIAIPLPDSVLVEFRKLNRKMRSISRDVKWVRPESIHLTLKFLGNLEPATLDRVFAAMDRCFQSAQEKFSLMVGGLGAFPHLKRPRALWVGVQGEGFKHLLSLQQQIEMELAEEGFEKEKRKFSPHLTVGRVKFTGHLEELLKTFMEYPFPEMNFTVERIQIMRSELKSDGAVYSVQREYFLSD